MIQHIHSLNLPVHTVDAFHAVDRLIRRGFSPTDALHRMRRHYHPPTHRPGWSRKGRSVPGARLTAKQRARYAAKHPI